VSAHEASANDYLLQFGGHGSGNGQLNYVSGVALDPTGNVYAVDVGNARVEKFSAGRLHVAVRRPGRGQRAVPRAQRGGDRTSAAHAGPGRRGNCGRRRASRLRSRSSPPAAR
jgi:hypothetical protein